jgi:hypothetical protein
VKSYASFANVFYLLAACTVCSYVYHLVDLLMSIPLQAYEVPQQSAKPLMAQTLYYLLFVHLAHVILLVWCVLSAKRPISSS